MRIADSCMKKEKEKEQILLYSVNSLLQRYITWKLDCLIG